MYIFFVVLGLRLFFCEAISEVPQSRQDSYGYFRPHVRDISTIHGFFFYFDFYYWRLLDSCVTWIEDYTYCYYLIVSFSVLLFALSILRLSFLLLLPLNTFRISHTILGRSTVVILYIPTGGVVPFYVFFLRWSLLSTISKVHSETVCFRFGSCRGLRLRG